MKILWALIRGAVMAFALMMAILVIGVLYVPMWTWAQAVLQDGTVFIGHLVFSPGPTTPPPTTTSCTLTAGSTDTIGGCAATATSGVAVIFGKPFATAPFCVVLDHTTSSGNALATEPTTTTFVLGTTVSGDKITWVCGAKSGG